MDLLCNGGNILLLNLIGEFDKIKEIKRLYVTGETRTNRGGAYSDGMAVRLG